MQAGADTPRGARIALWGGREIVALIIVSLAAGCATMPYVGYHFHRLGPYGVVANLLAMPIVSALVMPAGLVALIAIPFGFDAPLWKLMGLGIDWMIWVAQFVAGLPGAVGRIVALPFAAEAFEEDCRQAALVVSQRTAPPSCAAAKVDRTEWPRTGATALYRRANGWDRVVAFPPGYDRPWARLRPARTESGAPSSSARSAPRDATPRAEDLSAED